MASSKPRYKLVVRDESDIGTTECQDWKVKEKCLVNLEIPPGLPAESEAEILSKFAQDESFIEGYNYPHNEPAQIQPEIKVSRGSSIAQYVMQAVCLGIIISSLLAV